MSYGSWRHVPEADMSTTSAALNWARLGASWSSDLVRRSTVLRAYTGSDLTGAEPASEQTERAERRQGSLRGRESRCDVTWKVGWSGVVGRRWSHLVGVIRLSHPRLLVTMATPWSQIGVSAGRKQDCLCVKRSFFCEFFTRLSPVWVAFAEIFQSPAASSSALLSLFFFCFFNKLPQGTAIGF